jgi:hypothetical protein
MKNRYPLWLLIVTVCSPLVGLVFMGASFLFQAIRLLLFGSGFVLIALPMFGAGLLQLRTSKVTGIVIPWWRQAQIMLALFFFLFGGLYLLIAFHIPEIVGDTFIIFYTIITFVLGIYAIWLALLYAIDANKKRQAQRLRG